MRKPVPANAPRRADPSVAPALALALVCTLGGVPHARAAGDDSTVEFWPEINAYVGLDERSRLMFSAAGTRATEAVQNGRLFAVEDVQFTANVDYTLAPVLRRDVPEAEWSKNRLLWARLGFQYGRSAGSADSGYRAYTGLVELNSRFPWGEASWLTNRLRVDFRDVNGQPSQRYRIRVGAEWAEQAFGHPIQPYTSVELMYDTRYEQWNRMLLKAGLETPLGGNWRVEPYLALEVNRPDEQITHVFGIGLTFKVYFD